MSTPKFNSKKAIAVIDDVLSLIKLKGLQVLARNGYVKKTNGDNDPEGFSTEGVSLKPLIRKGLINNKKPCQVCAKGALFLGFVDKFNKVKVPYSLAIDGDIYGEECTDQLSEIWPEVQLNLIEDFFEQGEYVSIELMHNSRDIANPFYVEGDDQATLKNILLHMKANGGRFVIYPEWL